MLRSVIAAVLAGGFAMSVSAKEAAGPPCPSLEQSKQDIQKAAEARGAGFVALDGKDAQAFLDILNRTGTPTDFRSQHVGLLLYVTQGAGMLVFDDGPCHGYMRGLPLPLGFVMQTYSAIRGTAVKPPAGGLPI